MIFTSDDYMEEFVYRTRVNYNRLMSLNRKEEEEIEEDYR